MYTVVARVPATVTFVRVAAITEFLTAHHAVVLALLSWVGFFAAGALEWRVEFFFFRARVAHELGPVPTGLAHSLGAFVAHEVELVDAVVSATGA
jgi:hypothetical protein